MQYNQYKYISLFENFCKQCEIDGKSVQAKISGIPLSLKVSSTQDSITRGYRDLPEPKSGEGMLFVYEDETPLEFWMKGVDYPLDIMFFDSNMNLIEYMTMEPCRDLRDQDLPKYKCKKPARFAVEVPGGWCENNIDQDCTLSF